MNAIRTKRRIPRPESLQSPVAKTFTDPSNSYQSFTETVSVSENSVDTVPRENEPIAKRSTQADSFQLYLREIGQVRLLTPEQEIELAERINRGDEAAREQMIKANLRLVVKIARDYEGLGLPLLDLVSEGNIGLIKGVERFDPSKGAKLSTYAAWWIKQSIKRALANQSKTIRLPEHVTHKLAHLRRAEFKLRETLERDATDEELAQDLELNPRRLRQYREASRAPVCLDSPISSEDSTPILETVADENASTPLDELLRESDNGLLHLGLASLDPRANKILAMRFGLDDGESRTLDEIGEHFGVSRERIRQIQDGALKKMRERIKKRDPLSNLPSNGRRKNQSALVGCYPRNEN